MFSGSLIEEEAVDFVRKSVSERVVVRWRGRFCCCCCVFACELLSAVAVVGGLLVLELWEEGGVRPGLAPNPQANLIVVLGWTFQPEGRCGPKIG